MKQNGGCYVVFFMYLFAFIPGCNAGQKYLPPSSGLWGHYSFSVDEKKQLSIQVPAGGEEGSWTLYEVDTKTNTEKIIQFLAISYDLNQKDFEPYSLSTFLFGLARNPKKKSCDINCLASYKQKKLSLIDKKTIDKKIVEGKNYVVLMHETEYQDRVIQYISPFDDEYFVYMTLIIDKEGIGSEAFIKERQDLLRKIASSLEIRKLKGVEIKRGR